MRKRRKVGGEGRVWRVREGEVGVEGVINKHSSTAHISLLLWKCCYGLTVY